MHVCMYIREQRSEYNKDLVRVLLPIGEHVCACTLVCSCIVWLKCIELLLLCILCEIVKHEFLLCISYSFVFACFCHYWSLLSCT